MIAFSYYGKRIHFLTLSVSLRIFLLVFVQALLAQTKMQNKTLADLHLQPEVNGVEAGVLVQLVAVPDDQRHALARDHLVPKALVDQSRAVDLVAKW